MKPLPSSERLHELFEYRDGCLFYKNDLHNSLGRKTKIVAGTRAGGLHPLGYRKIRVDGVMFTEHRIVWQMFNPEPCDFILDHINNKRDDNRIENLRKADRSKNSQNSFMRKDNSSGVKGVHWNNRDKRYTVSLSFDGIRKVFGHFIDFELAELVAAEARNKFHGSFANHGFRGV